MASALEKDLDPNTYIGLSFPLRKDNNTDFAMKKKLDEPFQVGYLISIYKKLILLLMMVMKIKFL